MMEGETMTRMKIAATGGVLAAAILGTLPAGVFAAKQSAAATAITRLTKQLQHQADGRAIAFGTLTSTGTNSVTISTPGQSSLTIPLVAKAKVTARTQAAAAAGYKTGDQVLVNGTYRNGFVGRSVVYDTAAFPVPGVERIAGKVSASSAQSLTVTLANSSSAQVQLGTATRYFNNGVPASAAPTFTSGERVTVLAQEQTDGSLLARIVAAGTLNAPAKAAVRVAGTITAVAADNGSFTLTLASGKTATVTISTATKFLVNGKAPATTPALTASEKVVVAGTRSTDAAGNVTIAATVINIKSAA
jgi:hypothetical protein